MTQHVRQEAIRQFITAVGKPRLPGMFNPWSDSCPTETEKDGHLARRRRLEIHMDRSPRVVIIGEAPGYQGCRYSGIAFTSERLLHQGAVPGMGVVPRITTRPRPWSEPSATIVWEALYQLGLAEETVMFNAVPWHPMGKGGPHSNRTPTPTEVEAGEPFLRQFLAIYPGVPVVALGNTAAGLLERIGVQASTVRHPANGGATKFRTGMAELVKQGVL